MKSILEEHYIPISDMTKTKWPRQLTAKVLSYPSGLRWLSGGKAIPALQTTISNLPMLPVSEFWLIFSLRLFAEYLALSMVDKSSL
jgi:hypothetical protein